MPKDNRILIAIGAAAAVVIAVIVGLLMTRGGDEPAVRRRPPKVVSPSPWPMRPAWIRPAPCAAM